MSYRGQRSGVYEGRSPQAPGMMRPWFDSRDQSLLARGHLHQISIELAEKISVQEAEINRLDGENRRLASTQVVLRQELVDAQQEIQGAEALIRSIRTEGDLQIRILLDKTAKWELDIRSGPILRKELQQAHAEAQNWKNNTVTVRSDSGYKRERSERNGRDGEGLGEHGREAEKLRINLINAEQRTLAPVPHGDAYTNPYSSQPHQQGSHPSGANYGKSHFHLGDGIAGDNMVPVGSNSGGVAPGGVNVAAQPTQGRI
ncbi:unnamed protein product [Rhodiola kirilowii]